MPTVPSISPDKLFRLVGTHRAPLVIDLRAVPAQSADHRLIPASVLRSEADLHAWAPALRTQKLIVACEDGGAASHGVAAWLRHEGAQAEVLDGGFAAWSRTRLPLIPAALLPARDSNGRTVWVTRARPKVDRIACPWLIRRFIDPFAVILYVPASDVFDVAKRFQGAPFDISGPGAFWQHRETLCTFDVMLDELGLRSVEALSRLSVIIRGADTGRLEISPEAPGLLAASLGLSRMYSDDLEQLEAGLLLYDAFYRWCRDAVDETHDAASHVPPKPRRPS